MREPHVGPVRDLGGQVTDAHQRLEARLLQLQHAANVQPQEPDQVGQGGRRCLLGIVGVQQAL